MGAPTLEARARKFLPPAELCQVLYREVFLNAKQSVLFQRTCSNGAWSWILATPVGKVLEKTARSVLPDPNDPDCTMNTVDINGWSFNRQLKGNKNGYPIYQWVRN